MNLPVGIGAAPFRRVPSSGVIQPAPSLPVPVSAPALPTVPSASRVLQQQLMQQALPEQSSLGSDYQWATLNTTVTIGGHTFPAGTKIVVSLGQKSTSGGGKAHTTSSVVKVWVKFGQTFDSSSWLEGNIAENLFSLTGQSATWSNATGFGGPDGRMPMAHAAATSAAYSAPQQSFPDYGSMPSLPPNPMSGAYGGVLSAQQTFVDLQRQQPSNATDGGGHLYGRPAPEPPNYPRPPTGTKKKGTGADLPPAAAPPTEFDKIAPYAYGFVAVVAVGIFAGVLTMKPGRR